MILFVIAMVVTITAVYAVRRLKIDNAWTYAIAAGIVVQFIVLLAGILVTGAKINLILMIVGTVLGGVVGYLCQILFSVWIIPERNTYSMKMMSTIIT